MTKVKICGITNPDDARAALSLGAHALGFVFAPSPRRVTPERAREIIAGLPPLVKTVGVFVNEEPARLKEIMAFCGLDLVQLHGKEPPQTCRELSPRVIKAFRVGDRSSLAELGSYVGKVRAYLLDTFVVGKKGGTGETFDWHLAAGARAFGVPVILSGGLNTSNITAAVSSLHPYAVDVNSGVEEKPGKKSERLMSEFMENIRKVDQGNAASR